MQLKRSLSRLLIIKYCTAIDFRSMNMLFIKRTWVELEEGGRYSMDTPIAIDEFVYTKSSRYSVSIGRSRDVGAGHLIDCYYKLTITGNSIK